MIDGPQEWLPTQLADGWSRPLEGGYRLWVHCPATPEGENALPILWLLDGAALFPAVAGVASWLGRRPDGNGVGRMLVAAIDHDPPDPRRRYLDYSFGPPDDPNEVPRDVRWGGGARFAALLAGPASRAVGSRFRFDPARQAVLGHSLAGQFVLRLLAEGASAFRVIGAISPSIWWDSQGLEEGLALADSDGQAVFLAAGGEEEPLSIGSPADDRRRRREMVSNVKAAAGILARSLHTERIECHIAPKETHGSAIISLLPCYLRFVARILNSTGTQG